MTLKFPGLMFLRVALRFWRKTRCYLVAVRPSGDHAVASDASYTKSQSFMPLLAQQFAGTDPSTFIKIRKVSRSA